MSLPSFLRGIIDRFKKGGVDSDDCIQAKEAEEPKGRSQDFSRNQERGRDPPPQRHERPRQGQQVATCNMVESTVSSGVNNIENNVLLNLEVGPGERDINSLLEVAVCYETRQMTTYPLIMSQTFFTNVMGNLKALTPPICQEKVIGASGAELVPLGCFQVHISFPLLLDWLKVALTCCVYQNLLSDILMGSAYLKYVSPRHPLTVFQFTMWYAFNSSEYSQPSLTPLQAHQCNQELTRHVFTANRRPGQCFTNPGLIKITEMWEREGHSAHRTPPPGRVLGVSMDKYGGYIPPPHR